MLHRLTRSLTSPIFASVTALGIVAVFFATDHEQKTPKDALLIALAFIAGISCIAAFFLSTSPEASAKIKLALKAKAQTISPLILVITGICGWIVAFGFSWQVTATNQATPYFRGLLTAMIIGFFGGLLCQVLAENHPRVTPLAKFGLIFLSAGWLFLLANAAGEIVF